MDLTGEQLIAAPRETVWRALNDPEILRQCIPGCEELHALGGDGYEAAVTARIGPVRARFKCKVMLSDIDPPHGYTISGEAQGGAAAGFGKGSAKVALAEESGSTRLSYAATAQIGGKLAQLGARMIEPVAAKMAEEFFGGFNRLLAPPATTAPAPATAPMPAEKAPAAIQRPRAWHWPAALVLLASALAGWFFLFSNADWR